MKSTQIKLPPGESTVNGIDLRDHAGLVHMVAGRIWRAWRMQPRGGVTYEDIFAAGLAGLYRAAKRFDPARGFRFSTFAVWWVRHHIGRTLDDTSRTVRVPVHTLSKGRKGLVANPLDALSLDTPIGTDEQEGRTFGDLLADPSAASPENVAVEGDLRARLAAALATLPARDRDILESRLDGETLIDIGERHGISRERVRQLEEDIVALLRARVLGPPGASRVTRIARARASAAARRRAAVRRAA